MRRGKLLKSFQWHLLVAAIFLCSTSLSHAADDDTEGKTSNIQPESTETPYQQATPAQPSVEPLDDDSDTFLV